MTSPPSLPCLTLEEVYGRGTCFNPRATFGAHVWHVDDQAVRDFSARIAMTDPGSTPFPCARAVYRPEARQLLELAGHVVSQNAVLYSTESEYLAILRHWAETDRKVAFQYLHSEAEVPYACYWIPPQVLSDLNNKAFLEDYVPAPHAPRRCVMEPGEILSLALSTRPLVLKAASRWGGGGGSDVVLARTAADLHRAARLFADELVVLEEYLDIDRDVCVNVASVGDEIRVIGTAEQIIDQQGKFCGNWIVPDAAHEETVRLACEIMRRAMDRGYRGFAGFDVAVTRDGRILAYDLNFRMNSSTRPLLTYESIQRKFGPATMGHYTTMTFTGGFSAMCRAAEQAIRQGVIMPFAFYDPAVSPLSSARSRATMLVLGTSRDEVVRAHAWLSELGFQSSLVSRQSAA